MKRIVIFLYVALMLFVVSCRRETTVTQTQTATTGTTTTTIAGEPRDLKDANINLAISPDKGQFVTNTRIGPALGADGLVAEEKTEFTSDQDIHLSLWLKESPAGLQTGAVVQDTNGKEVDIERRPMKGEKTVTFTLGDKKLKPGKYVVTGYWGGNVAAEYEITVTEGKASSPSKAKTKAKATKKS